jgi:predicted XRE-type DNA-binding protein
MATVRTVKKLMLGREIAHMIETAGLSQAQAGALIEVGQSRIAGLIKGEGRISTGDLVMLANKLGFTDEGYHESLLELRRDSHRRGHWSSGYHRAYFEDLRLLIDLEKNADLIRILGLEIIPGLAQCEAYVRALNTGSAPKNDLSLEDLVRARLARQNIYEKDNPPQVHFVLSESCLRRAWGDAKVMREQFDYLIELSHNPRIQLQVIPFNVPVEKRVMIRSPFTIIQVPSSGVTGPLELVYTEGEEEFRYLDDKKALTAYDNTWVSLTSAALSVKDTRKFIQELSRGYSQLI